MPQEVCTNKETLQEVVRMDGRFLEFACQELQADKEVVLEAVKQHGPALRHASEALRADPEVVLAAVRQKGVALQEASEQCRSVKEIVLEAVKRGGYVLRCASADLRDDREVVLEAVRQNGAALQYASEALRADRDVVLEAVKEYGPAWLKASKELRTDKDLLLLAARSLRREDPRYDYSDSYQAIVAMRLPEKPIHSSIAAAGEEAPSLSVSMSHVSASAGEAEGTNLGPSFLCEIRLLSGKTFSCRLPDQRSTDRWGTTRRHPILDDLATKLAEDVNKHLEAQTMKRVFLTFLPTDVEEEDAVVATPWDWDKLLSDFLPASQQRSRGGRICSALMGALLPGR